MDFAAATGAGPAVLDVLRIYDAILRQWNAHTNLVSPATLGDIWRRHFLDSAQLAPHIPTTAQTILDIGSGAGFPGLVLAALQPDPNSPVLHLIDATQKKCRFLAEAADAMSLKVKIHWGRAEELAPLGADVVTARAVAPLETLFGYIDRHIRPGGLALLLKGAKANEELTAARRTWDFAAEQAPSCTDSAGVILSVTGLKRCPKRTKRS